MKPSIFTIKSLLIILLLIPYANAQTTIEQSISLLQSRWAEIKYQLPEKDEQIKALRALEDKAEQLINDNPDQVEFKIWQAIILATDAGITNSFSSLGMLKKAKTLLIDSIERDPDALAGSAYTSLASLYYQAPGWPLSFGNDKKAQTYFSQALRINPTGIDPNYFYGDFLMKQENYDKAKEYLTKAMVAPPRLGREVADEGRRQEIRAALSTIADKISQ